MYFHKHELNLKGNAYEVILYMKPHHSLEEFAEEFGLTKRAEEDINRVARGYVKNKFPTLKVKAIKVMMGGALVTTIMFGGSMTQAFAHEHETTTQTETTTETTTPDGTTDATTETTTDTTTGESSPTDEATDISPVEEGTAAEPTPEEPVTEEPTEEVPMDEPGLVPGDFFYFVEAIAEKVQLALTFNDTAKAELISEFANERIAEANALFEAGDTDGAIDLLNKALESQELALDYVAEEENLDETTPEGDLPPEETEGEPGPTEDEAAVPNDEAAEEDPASEVRAELQTQFSQNITALLLAMEKVENPKAKAALAKNVEKAFAKMEKRLGKMKDIEERIAGASPVDEDVEDLRKDIRDDQEDFESDMEEVEGEATAAGVVSPVAPKNAQDKAQKGTEKAQAGQQKGHEKASQGTEKAGKGQEKATQGKQSGQERQNEKRTGAPAPKNEAKEERASKGNANAGAKAGASAGNKGKVETEVNANVEAETEVTPAPKGNERAKGNEGKGNPGKGNGKNNE